jgi:hypothetical protein
MPRPWSSRLSGLAPLERLEQTSFWAQSLAEVQIRFGSDPYPSRLNSIILNINSLLLRRVEDCRGLFCLPPLKDTALSLENERNWAVSEAFIPIRAQLRRHRSFVAKIPHSLNRRAPSQVATSRKLHDSPHVISCQSNGFSRVIQVLKTHKCAKERSVFKLLGGNRHQAHPRDDDP